MSAQQPRKRNSPSPPKRKSTSVSPPRRPLHQRSDSDVNAAHGANSSGSNSPKKRNSNKRQKSADVFPRLPAQFLPPHENQAINFEQNGAGRLVNISPGSTTSRLPTSPSWPTVITERSRTETMSTDFWQSDTFPTLGNPLPSTASSATPSRAPGSLVSYMRQKYEQADAAARSSQISLGTHRSVFVPTPSSPRSQRASLVTPLEPMLADDMASPIVDEDAESPTIHQAKELSFEKSSTPSMIKPPIPERHPNRPQSKDDKENEQPSSVQVFKSHELRRSFSNPAAHTDAFLQALIQDENNENVVQYPILKKPSSSSLASNSSSLRRVAYPAPLRLRKKRGNLQLGRTAARQQSFNESRSRPTSSRGRSLRARASNLSAASSYRYASDQENEDPQRRTSRHVRDPSNPNALRLSTGWADEVHDTVSELYPLPIHRSSSFYLNSAATSRVNLDEPPRDSFYYWFNDSHTRWAKAFYRGGGKLPLDAPPRVTQLDDSDLARSVESLRTPLESRSASSRSSLSNADSPPSTGFPEQIYIPRSRPLRRQWESVESLPREMPYESDWGSVYSLPSNFEPEVIRPSIRHIRDDDTINFSDSQDDYANETQVQRPPLAVIHDSDPLEPPSDPIEPADLHASVLRHQYPRQTQETNRQVSEAYSKRTMGSRRSRLSQRMSKPLGWQSRPENAFIVPRLHLDRRAGDGIPVWTAPSMDDKPGPFNKLNRQVWLFFLGFFFPLAWMIASFLPLPPRPCWRRRAPSDAASDKENVPDVVDTDLFDIHEVWRYRKARWWRITNRFMSVTGLCIIAVVIACAVIGTR